MQRIYGKIIQNRFRWGPPITSYHHNRKLTAILLFLNKFAKNLDQTFENFLNFASELFEIIVENFSSFGWGLRPESPVRAYAYNSYFFLNTAPKMKGFLKRLHLLKISH